MQIFRYEWKKVTRKKLFWAISILLFFLNGVLFFYNQYYTEEYRAFGVFRQEYEKFQKKIEKIQPKEREEVLLEWQNIYSMAGSISANKALRADFTEEDEEIFQMQLEQYQREQPEVYEQAVEIAKQEDFDVWEKYITDYLEQIQYQTEYKDYIANMKKRTKNQLSNPVFKKGSYAYYNLLKSCIDFEKCKNINTEIGEHCGVEAATGFTLTDFFVFGILFLLGIYLCMQEKENGLLCLVRSNVKGRYKVAWAKCLIVFIINMLICLLFYGADLFLSYQLYGFGDTSRMVQSIPAFRNCSLLITIEQYLFIWILLKIVVSLIFSMLVMCMLQLASNGKLVCVILLAFLGSEYLLNYYIKDRSIFSYFKYINIFCFSDGKKLLQNYVNLNLFGKPINIYAVGIIIGIIGFTVFLFGMIWLYPKQRQIGKWEGFSFVEILRKKFYRKRYCTKLWLFEVKKYFIQEKMFLVIIAVIGMGVIFYQGYQTERYGDNKEAVYVSYMQKLEGTWNTEKENYYQSQVRYFEDLKEELEELRDGTSDLKGEENYQRKAVITAILDTQQEGFYDISNQYEHMQRIHEKYGVDLEFPNEYACRKLFYTKDDDVKLFAWLMVWVVVSIESLFWVEYKKNLYQLVHSTPKGRAELFRIKCAIGVGVGVFSFIATYLPKILSVYKQYGSKSLFCHLKLMPQFQCCGSDMTMIKAFVCMMITRFLLLLAAVMVAIMISVWCKNYLRAIIFTAVVLFVPCVFVSQNELLRIVEFILHPQNWNIMIGIWGVLFISIFLLYRKAKKIFGK